MAAQIDPKSIDAAADSREERLARRVADLYADDQQFRDAASLEEITAAVNQPGARLAQIMKTVMEAYAERPALGQRARELATDAATGRRTLRLLPRFETITYGELWARIGAITGAWHHDPVRPVRAGDFVCTLGFTSGDYATVDLACSYLGAVSVPLHSTAPVTQLVPIITETQPRILAASIEYLDTAIACILAGTSLAILVVFDYHPEDDDQKDAFESARRRLADAGSPVLLESLNTVLERGSTLPPAPLFVPGADDNPLAMLIYTSGSTGTPKGAIYPESLVTVFWRGGTLETASLPAIDINYLPLSHTYGRALLTKTLAAGGTAYFAAKSDMSTLFKDIALVRPTSFGFVPRVCELAFQWYQSELDRKASGSGDQSAIEQEVKVDMRQNLFGGRVVLALCASAPLSKEMKAFMESVLDVKLHDGYGATEALDTMVDGRVKRPPVIDYKLVDVPELGYFLTDKPYARGELLLKSETLIPGYYKRPDVKAEMFDEYGYYKTGDIMAEIEPDHLTYLDRRNNVLKLSQGEFVTVAKLEAVYSTSPYVRQIFVYGNSTQSFLLAVIVTNMEAIGPDKTLDDAKSLISDSLQQIAKEADLNSYEIPRDFLIETEPFTSANGLLSGIGKLLRPKLKERYGARLEQMYADIAKAQVDELHVLRHIGCDQPVIETISRAAQALFRCSTADLKPDAHFTDLGGDSLTALSFSQLIQAIFDIEVPVGVIVSPANKLQRLADYIEAQRTPGAKQPTFATVHGRDSSEIRASDLTLDKFIDARTLVDATALPRPSGAAQTVLLTGANGYLGRFLCLEWLERLNPTGGKLICIIRGNDAAAARRRLDVAFDSGDAELIRHFQELAGENLEVLAGDIGDLNLGLSEQTWNRVAEDVDLIVHPAALVNHVLPYNQLFGPNVVGTTEIIRLALTKRMKPVTHLSSVAVFGQIDPSAFSEDADVRVMSSVRAIDESYANGYGNSKWASEVLLREAHDLCGLPVAVFRSDMILAHSEYTGQLNVPDVFTRLLLSLLLTGIAPYSFYEIDAQGNRQRAHYDGVPADFTAETITTLSEQITGGFRTFHVVNPHDDSISLDQFVDWLIKAGHPIQRIDDYGDWFARFETAIRALPEKQKQNSLLPLIHAYERPSPAIPGSPFPTDGFQAAVQAAEIGPDKDILHLSESFINKYVTDLRHLGLLPHTAGANHV